MKQFKERAAEDNFIMLVNKDEKPGELSKLSFIQTKSGEMKADMDPSCIMDHLDSESGDYDHAEHEEEYN